MNKQRTFYLLLFSLMLVLSSCSFSSTADVPIQAGLDSKTDGFKPVRRTDFYLTKEHERDIEAKIGKPAINYENIYPENFREFIVATATTDFDGKAVFKNVPKGTYHVLGATTIPDGDVNWSHKIEVGDKAETVFLDFKTANQIKPL